MAKNHHSPQMNRLALELGYISIYWGWLEDAIDSMIATLAPLEDGHVAEAITGNTDIRQKIQMVKALAFVRKASHSDWYGSVTETLNTIDNDLRSRRNIFVHAGWYYPKGRLMRHKKGVKIAKPQSFQPPELKTIDIAPIKLGECRKLRTHIMLTLKKVVYQTSFAREADYCASRGISFQQFLRLAGPSGRQARKHSGPKRQPPPSHL